MSLLLLLAAALAAAEPLVFEARQGGHHDVFHQDASTAFHARLTEPSYPRLIVAFPAANSGLAFWFRPGVRWTMKGHGVWNRRGARVDLETAEKEAVIERAVLDSMRLIRYPSAHEEAVPLRLELAKLLGLDAAGWADAKLVIAGAGAVLTRRTLDGKNRYEARLTFENARLEPAGRGLRAVSSDGAGLKLRVEARVDYAPLTPFPPEKLLSQRALALYRSKKDDGYNAAIDRLRFLSYREKFLAGSNRFNTYFGRDTLITLMLAWDQLSSEARLAAVGSVLDRVSKDGVVAHEEDIGGQAELARVHAAIGPARRGDLDAARAVVAAGQAPIYDYKMIDGEALLVIAAHRLLSEPGGMALLEAKRAPLHRVLERLAKDAAPYARAVAAGEKGPALARRLIPFRHETVGDWRDSNDGNGGGRFSYSVNGVLVPRALALAGGLTARKAAFTELANAWALSKEHFKVSLSAEEARRRLDDYLGAQPDGERLRKRAPDILGPVEFDAVALDAEGSPVPVMNSEGALDLLVGGSPDLAPFERPFPLGLRTEAGFVVANPAFSDRPADRSLFGRDDYHGVVIWGWQQNALMVGAGRRGLKDAAKRAARDMAAAGAYANLELWTFKLAEDGQASAAPLVYTSDARDDADPNPAQLWSAVRPQPFLD